MLKIKRLPLSTVLFILIPTLVAIIAFFKLSPANDKTVYAKIKVSQGLWWAATKEPSLWLEDALQVGDKELGFLGEPIAKIEDVTVYEVLDKPEEDRVSIYFVAKLKTSFNKTEKKYSFKRSSLVIGSPIEIETNRTLITGTVLEISEEPFNNNYQDKIVIIIKENAYPWEYNAIKTGDTYSDGKDVVFEVISKKILGPSSFYKGDIYSNVSPNTLDPTLRITVTAKIKVKEKNGKFLWGEEKIVKPGSPLPISTTNFDFQDFYISAVNDL
jgi:hypothetical protein